MVKENYRRFTCTGKSGTGEDACGFSFGKTPAGRTFEVAEVEQLLRDKQIGPLEGFRSKAGWPFTSEIVLKYNEEEKNWKLEFDFGDDKNAAETGEIVDFSGQQPLGPCPKCGAPRLRVRQQLRLREVRAARPGSPRRAATSRAGKIILQQPVEREQMTKLLADGKTDLLDKFVSMRTRRPFKAFLAWDKEAGKVNFEFAPSKFPPRKERPPGKTPAAQGAGGEVRAGAKAAKAAAKAAAKKAPAKKAAAAKAPRKTGPGLKPSTELAAVIGAEPVARTEVIKKLWDYIKANGLQDAPTSARSTPMPSCCRCSASRR